MTHENDDLPALLGGKPIFPDGPPPWPQPDPAVKVALNDAYSSGAWGQYHGPNVSALEAELATFHGVPHALTCATGTLAVEAGLRALGVGPGDEVILAAYEYESNFLTVHALGAKPVLADVAPNNWNLDPAAAAAAVSRATKAVVCSHLHGGLIPMREIVALARRHGFGVLEDAAQAPGATVQGRPTGAWGDVGTLSFGGSKLLTAGRGGAMLFNDTRHFQRAKVWLSRGVQQWAPLSELQAAVLRPQLAGLWGRTVVRWLCVGNLTEAIERAGIPGLVPFQNTSDAFEAAFYKLGFRFDPEAFGLTRERFVAAMRAEGVAFDIGFRALHVGRSPSRFRAAGTLDEAARAHHGCVVLHHPILAGSAADAERVVRAVVRTYRNRDRLRDPQPKGPP